MLGGLALEVRAGSLLVKGQRLALVHEQDVAQHDAYRPLVVLHPRVPAGQREKQEEDRKQEQEQEEGISSGEAWPPRILHTLHIPDTSATFATFTQRTSWHTTPPQPPCPHPLPPPPAAHPAAAAMRPQLGSCPKMALLAREDPTMLLDTALAAASSGAPSTSHSMSTVAPSPSQAIDLARPCEGWGWAMVVLVGWELLWESVKQVVGGWVGGWVDGQQQDQHITTGTYPGPLQTHTCSRAVSAASSF